MRAFDSLPDVCIDGDDPGRQLTGQKIEDVIATCRELVACMGWLADVASTNLGRAPVSDAQGWLLPELHTHRDAPFSTSIRGAQ